MTADLATAGVGAVLAAVLIEPRTAPAEPEPGVGDAVPQAATGCTSSSPPLLGRT